MQICNHCSKHYKIRHWANVMGWVSRSRHLLPKPEELSSIPGTHMVEADKPLLQAVL